MSATSPQTSIAVTHFAGRAGDHNDRAMAASPRLASALATRFTTPATVIGAPQPALATTWDAELGAAREDLSRMCAHYRSILSRGLTPVTALSRCAVALATLPVIAEHHPDAVVLWFDAHADINTPENTATGYLGGLALAGPLGLWDSGLGAGLAMEHTILAGVRDIYPPGAGLLDTTELTLVAPGPDFGERLGRAVDGRPVYIHIDCDVLDPGTVPTDYRVPGGLTLADLHDAATAVAGSRVVGIEIGQLETATGEEDLAPLLDALEPEFAAIRGE